MTHTSHPCANRTRTMREAFEAIAVGQDAGHSHMTIRALLKAELIVVTHPRRIGVVDPVMVARYAVPWPVHMQWCEWCSENVR